MKFIKLHNFNFRHLILGIIAFTILVLSILVSFISSQIAYNEMSNTLYQQSVNFTHNLAKESIAPLLFDSSSGAKDIIKTLLDLKQITEVRIIRTSNKSLAQNTNEEHISNPYPDVTTEHPFDVIETDIGWYFSAIVMNKLDSGNPTNLISSNDAPIIRELGHVNLGVSKSSIYASRKNIFIRNFSVSFIAGFLLLLTIYQVLRTLTRPLERLSALMEQGQRGEYPEETNVYGTKELNDYGLKVHRLATED